MILTGQKIIDEIASGHIRIEPFNIEKVQPNGIDLTIAAEYSYYQLSDRFTKIGQINSDTDYLYYGLSAILNPNDENAKYHRYVPFLDTNGENTLITRKIPDDGIILFPNNLYLFKTNETVWSDKYVAEISGKSSLARLGISVHKTAGYANIGHEFAWVLEVEVTYPVKIYKDMDFASMYFHEVLGDTNVQYNGKHKEENIDWMR